MKQIFFVPLLFLIATQSFAEISEPFINSLNNDLARYNKLKALSNSNHKSDSELIAEENEKYLKVLKGKVPKDGYAKAEKEILFYQDADPEDINKLYLAKIKASENKKMNKESQVQLNKLLDSSTRFLAKGFAKEASLAVNKPSNNKFIDEKELSASWPVANEDVKNKEGTGSKEASNVDDKLMQLMQPKSLVRKDMLQYQAEVEKALLYKNENPEKFNKDENDSLFEIISKTYIRNYDKLKR